MTDSALRARLGAAGPARASQFSVSRMVEGTSLVYERVLRATRRRVRR